MSVPLHWSFDYSRFSGEAFAAELTAALDAVYADGAPEGPATEYIVLPNYWGGNPPDGQHTKLAYGRLSIRQTDTDNAIECQVGFYHDASGEEVDLRFRTDRSPLRQLRDAWRIDVSNHAGYEYQEFHAEGLVTDAREIRLASGEIPLLREKLPDERPLLCNWTLFDALPELATLPADTEFALLEGLEKLKPRCRVKPLDTYHLPLTGADLELRGYVLFGEAQMPYYFWLDSRDHVAIASGIFDTFVLRKTGGTP